MVINGQKWEMMIDDEALLKETRRRYIKAMTISIIAIVVNVIALAFWAAVFVKYGLLGWQAAGLLFVVADIFMIVIAVKEIFYVKGLFEELRPSWNMYMFRQMYEKKMKERKKK